MRPRRRNSRSQCFGFRDAENVQIRQSFELYSSAMKVLTHLTNKRTPWPESSNELYRPSDHRLSAKLVLTFADRVVSRSGSLTAIISVF
jgi:hypothetical protein